MTRPLLDISHLTRRFDAGSGIQDISFSVFPKEFILLAGPNGSGKTTLLRHLNALIRPDSGTVTLHGRPVTDHLTRTRQTIGMVFQDPDTQIVADTVFDDVAFGPENLNLPRARIQTIVDHTLARLKLTHLKARHPATLSGGEKRRLAIAGILVMAPEIIVMDEPFANLDYPSSREMVGIVRQLNQEGTTLLIATHELEMVIHCATRMLILDRQGRLVRDGHPDTLLSTLPAFGIKEPCFSRMGYPRCPWPI